MTDQPKIRCPTCGGLGRYGLPADIKPGNAPPEAPEKQCEECGGTGFVEDRRYQVKRTCPRCDDTEAALMPPRGDYSQYDCPQCGIYRVDGTMERLIELGTVDPKAARIEERGDKRWLT
jgi:DnaJ-class molecular chaperone